MRMRLGRKLPAVFGAFFLFTFLSLPAPSPAQPTPDAPLAPAAIERTDRVDPLPHLLARRMDVDDVHPGHVRAHLSREQFEELKARGYTIRWLPDESARQWRDYLADPEKAAEAPFSYPTYGELTARMAQWEATWPHLAQVESIGESVEGRELWFARITGPGGTGPDYRPIVSHVATMHGDEKVGTVLLVDFAERLLDGYGHDGPLTWVLDNTEIWIMPLMNPDGYSAPIPRRHNANWVDLNRDFPSWVCGDSDTAGERQPETIAMMEWNAGRQIVLQANQHGGALVVNYPFDECSLCGTSCAFSRTQLEATVREASLAWASANPRMSASTRFPDGVTNGAAWYSIYGSMQDWNYRYRGTIEVTVELDDTKIPSVELLEQIILENRQSIIDYTMMAHHGLRGFVVSAHEGLPLEATISLAGGDLLLRSDPATGGFHHILVPGVYTVVVEADGDPRTHRFEGIVVEEGLAEPVLFEIPPPPAGDFWMAR